MRSGFDGFQNLKTGYLGEGKIKEYQIRCRYIHILPLFVDVFQRILTVGNRTKTAGETSGFERHFSQQRIGGIGFHDENFDLSTNSGLIDSGG